MTPKELRQKSVNFAIQWMREHFPSQLTYPGTGLRDTVINAWAGMSWSMWQKMDQIEAAMDISKYNTVDVSSLDRGASVWFLPRNSSNRAKTVWRIYFSTPIDLRLTVGCRVGGGALKYMTTQPYSFSKSAMGNNSEGALYYVDFPVEASKAGSEYNVPANSLHDIFSYIAAPVVRSTNIIPATGGSSIETNEAYYNRLDRGANTRQNLITASSTISTLQAEFPSFDSINIQGKGDEFMNRDKQYGISGPGGQAPYIRSDFYFREESEARTGSSEYALPLLEDLKDEDKSIQLDYEEYKQISKFDLLYFQKSGGMIFTETFSASPVDFKMGDWMASDSGLPHGQKKYGNSSYINDQGLILGVPLITQAAVGE